MSGCTGEPHAKKIGVSVKQYWIDNPPTSEWCKKVSDSHKGQICTEAHQISRTASKYKAWYGNVRYPEDYPIRLYKQKYQGTQYCELWNWELKERIRAFWDYRSVLSGLEETTIDKNGRVYSISCHHVYYQKKACCVWDEDEKGYYAPINIATKKNPIINNYYINGDPNKFVALTMKEHRRTDTNKLRWIKTFEKIIDDNGGKCYFTKDEVYNFLISNE